VTTIKRPVDIARLFTGTAVLWHKPGRRAAIPCTVLATAPANGQVIVFDADRKQRRVPADQLERAK
jgi:hypothetical protein